MPSVEEVQMCLLSVMRAWDLVDETLRRLGVTEDHMREVAAATRGTYGFKGPVKAEVFQEALGPPQLEREMRPEETNHEMFHGSIHRRYSLPLWPAADFVVNQDAGGWAWGLSFQQRELVAPGEDPLDLARRAQPWEFTEDVLLNAAAEVERREEWSFDLEAVLTFRSPDGRVGRWHALFDFELLQSWIPVGSTVPPDITIHKVIDWPS